MSFLKGGIVDYMRKYFSVLVSQKKAAISTGLNHSWQQWLLWAFWNCVPLLESSRAAASFPSFYISAQEAVVAFPSSSLINQESMTLFCPWVLPMPSVGSEVFQSKFVTVIHILNILNSGIASIFSLKTGRIPWKDCPAIIQFPSTNVSKSLTVFFRLQKQLYTHTHTLPFTAQMISYIILCTLLFFMKYHHMNMNMNVERAPSMYVSAA